MDEILFGVGYFSLLYSSYILVLDRILLSDLPPLNHPLLRIAQDRRVFRLSLLIAVVLGIVASTTNSNGQSTPTSRALHITSTVIFLVLTVIQAFQTGYLASSSISGRSQYYQRGKDSVGMRYGNYILLIISLLLLVREAFATATVSNVAKQENEHFWYPFLAVTEVLVVIFYTTPGLVPRKDEVPSYTLAGGSAA